MNEKITQLLSDWQEKINLRNLYTFDEEEISLTEFAELFKNTFEIIRKAKNEFIYKSVLPRDVFDSLDYLQLLTTLSKYTTYDCTDDESEDKVFTATCLIAQKLIEYATFLPCFTKTENGDFEYYDSDEENQGIFTFLREDYAFFDDADDDCDSCYTYSIYEANFDEILKLAALL